jgi:hypothetical protein
MIDVKGGEPLGQRMDWISPAFFITIQNKRSEPTLTPAGFTWAQVLRLWLRMTL